MKAILENPTVDVNVTEEETGVNLFWLAAYYGHANIIEVLAKTTIDRSNRHS